MLEMVARNFTVQEVPYSRPFQFSTDDERDFISLDELKPTMVQQNLTVQQPVSSYQPTYYELTNINEDPSSSLSYPASLSSSACTPTIIVSKVCDGIRNPPLRRKRKVSLQDVSDLDDDTGDDSKSCKTDENKKQNHSEIEKRRRDKMNTYITELSAMIPMCHAMSRKLDKLTVLRMAVQHLKTIRGAVHSYTEGQYKPSFLTDQELEQLILQAADGFLFVVGCDRGRILYVSQSVTKVLNYSQSDLLGQSLFDILHPKDVSKVKEQLFASDLNPRERLIDSKTMLPVKTDVPRGTSRLYPGARRSFFCRMKCRMSAQVKEEADTTTECHKRKAKLNSDKKFNVIQCTGYLKSWASAKIGVEETDEVESDSGNLSCLVAIGRVLPHISTVAFSNPGSNRVRPIQFVSRHALDGKFIFVDQRATLVLGYLPQEMLGTSMYEYYHADDIPILADRHKMALQANEYISTNVYRFRTKDGGFIKLQSEWKPFKNPWTKEIEYVISKNSLVLSDFGMVESSAGKQKSIQENFDFFSNSEEKDIHTMINSHMEASKIGREIAEQALNTQRRPADSCGSDTILLPVLSNGETHSTSDGYSPNFVPSPNHHYGTVRDNVTLNSVITADPDGSAVGTESTAEIIDIISQTDGQQSIVEQTPNTSIENNDEATMAVIMSLLEADAGLGGPMDFSGLPWPLP